VRVQECRSRARDRARSIDRSTVAIDVRIQRAFKPAIARTRRR
jgi:hypothetical protein